MPTEDFYSGLTLTQALRKFADHHFDPRTRHVSSFEVGLLETAIARLEEPIGPQVARGEQNAAWERLLQAYSTVFTSPESDLGIEVLSVPDRVAAALGLPVDEWATRGVAVDVESAPAEVERLLLGLMAERDGASSRSSRHYELINRALYQPAIPVEESEPRFDSLKGIIDKGSMTVVVAALVAVADHEPSWQGMIKLGTGCLFLKVVTATGERLAAWVKGDRPG